MGERYPFLQFVIDAAQVIAGAAAVIVLLGGTASACHRGGVGGLFGFLIAVAAAAVVYVVVMVKIEVLRVIFDIESNTRQVGVAAPEPPTPPPTAS